MWYWGKYQIVASEEHIDAAYTVVFTDYAQELYADSEEVAHEIAIAFLYEKERN